MTSQLEGALKAKIAKSFAGRLTRGTIRREVASALDTNGDPTSPAISTYTFEGIRETFTARYKAQSGIPDTDISILVLLGSTKPNMTPKQDDRVFLDKPWMTWHQVRKVLEIDPAGASAKLQAYEIAGPGG